MSRISLPNIFATNSAVDSIALQNQFGFSDWLKEKTSSQDFIALSLVVMLHITALFGMLYQFSNNSAQPIVSFTVTMMDVSATSSNIVATAASTASHANSQAAAHVEKSKVVDSAAVKAVEQGDAAKKSNSAQAHNSVQQTAVVAPTTPAVFDAAYLNNPAPSYPPLSRRFGEQGLVILDVFVGENGQAQNVKIKTTSGFDRLDSAALETVKKWKFLAAKQGETLVSAWVQVPVKFVLEK